MNSLQTIIEQAWENRACYKRRTIQKPLEVIELLDGVNCEVAEQRRHGR
jgi:hypothetical protein